MIEGNEMYLVMSGLDKIKYLISCSKKQIRGGEGIIIGTAIGTDIGAVTGDLAIWTAMGATAGGVVGSCKGNNAE